MLIANETAINAATSTLMTVMRRAMTTMRPTMRASDLFRAAGAPRHPR